MTIPKKTVVTKKIITPTKPIISSVAPLKASGWTLGAKISLALAAFLIPLTIGTWTPDRWEINKALVLMIAITVAWVCYWVGQFRRPESPWHWHPLDWLVLMLGITTIVGSVTSVTWWSSVVGIQGVYTETLPVTLAFMSIYLLSARLFRSSADRLIVWAALLGGIGLSLLIQLFQFSDLSILPGSLSTEPLLSTLANSSLQVALFAAIISTIGFFLWPKAKERWAQVSLAVLVTIGWLTLLLLGQAVGWAVFAVGMILVVLNSVSVSTASKQSSRLVIIVVALAAVGMLSQFFKLSTHSSLPSTQEVGLSQTVSAATAFSAVAARPVLGTGPNTWYDAFIQYRPLSYNSDPNWGGRYIRSGAEWSQLLATQGIAGLTLWIGIICIGGWEFWRQLKKRYSFTLVTSLFILAIVAIAGALATWSLTLMTLVWFGLGLGRAKIAAGEAPVAPKPSPMPALGFAVTVILAVVFWYPAIRVYASQVELAKTQQLITKQASTAKIIASLKKASQLDSHNIDAGVLLANAYALQIQEQVQANDTTAAQQSLQLATTTIRSVVVKNANNPAAFEAENNLLNGLAGYLPNPEQQANENFAALRKLEPANPIHDVGYGQTLLVVRARAAASTTSPADPAKQAAYQQQALAAFNEALRKKSDYLQARYARADANMTGGDFQAALADLNVLTDDSPSVGVLWMAKGVSLAQLGQLDAAITAFEQALQIDPTDVNTYLSYSQALSDAKKTDEAKAVLDRGLKAVPGDTDLDAALKKLTV